MTIHQHKQNCSICSSNNTSIVYEGNIRSGSFGKTTEDFYKVFYCGECGNRFIFPCPIEEDFYCTEKYRNSYNETIEKQKFWNSVGNENELRLSRIGIKNFVDKCIIDVGVGPGMFLDIIRGIAKETIAIEPAKFFHRELARHHSVYSYAAEAIKDGKKGDIVLSFNVIEHVPQPIEFLKELYQMMNDNGILYLMTPNHDDILMELVPDIFRPFYYRTAHLYYFDKTSIQYCLKEAGFVDVNVCYMHTMDVSNMLLWLKEHTPTGLGKIDVFDKRFDDMYRHYLEQNGRANYLWIEARK